MAFRASASSIHNRVSGMLFNLFFFPKSFSKSPSCNPSSPLFNGAHSPVCYYHIRLLMASSSAARRPGRPTTYAQVLHGHHLSQSTSCPPIRFILAATGHTLYVHKALDYTV
ncbi:hypothetical protein CYLTODRAFT_423502 [Cylindrobasidium torrendii FP15055 ss-10]|uniref:Uncharacterized protein n=1 Tax=Cylindrobasidium torrendii FP15055 ss-10 TaxID=1314674 RepID=A0A0D7B725_9AGAR|nr:hypothetical protein CYLTODRAFT_423502 [Cylindrobasidium torrendii FP15055 ss-10]